MLHFVLRSQAASLGTCLDAPYKKPYVSKAERLKPTMMDGTHARSVTLASVARGEAEGADSFALASPELRAVRFARKGVE